jgi:hypothetical protein
VTFYDGVNVLGGGTIANGKATLTTSLLGSGPRSLKAYYAGDTAYAPSTSSVWLQTVNAVPGYGFLGPSTYPTGGTNPSAVFLADFNADGNADIVVDNILFLGKGDGTFAKNVIQGSPIAIGDFNGDGKTDIAIITYLGSPVTHVPEGNISVLFGNGDGTFQTAAGATDIVGSLGSFATADFNGDGRADLAVSALTERIPCPGPCSSTMNILLGNGDGTFTSSAGVSGSSASLSFAIGDFNGDGKADLAVYSYGSPVNGINPSWSVYLGNGDGTFQPVANSLPPGDGSVLVGDFNGDGNLDLVTSSSVLLGNGDGTFQSPVNYGGGATSMGAGDFNGDGKLDLAAVTSGSLNIMFGNGDGTFQRPVSYSAGTSPTYLAAVSDFNGDSRLDVALVSASGLGVMLAGAPPNNAPATVSVVSGNNQTGVPGAPLAQNLVVRVLGSDGTPFAGATVSFAVTTGSAFLAPTTTTTAADGMAATSVTLSGKAGAIQITSSVNGLAPVTFSATAITTPSSLSIASGNHQTGTVGTSLGQKLVVQALGADGNPSAGGTVTFSVTSGMASVSPATVTIGADGIAATSVTLGGTAGAIQITASVAGAPPVMFSVTAVAASNGLPAPQIYSGGVMSAGLSSPPVETASPNATFSIFGQNFATLGTNRRVLPPDFVNGLMPTKLAGVCVLFGNQRAPISLVTASQLNVQVWSDRPR